MKSRFRSEKDISAERARLIIRSYKLRDAMKSDWSDMKRSFSFFSKLYRSIFGNKERKQHDGFFSNSWQEVAASFIGKSTMTLGRKIIRSIFE